METPGETIAWLAKDDGTAVVGHGPFTDSPEAPADHTAFYLQDFALNDPAPWKIPSRVEHIPARDLAARLSATTPPLDCVWQAPDANGFSSVFQEILSAIHSGTFEKTVPVITECGSSTHPPGPVIAAAMLRQAAPLRSYGWIAEDHGFAGATPELLFTLRGRHLETMALAGTARSDDRDVFAVDEKEIREHEYVAQTLVAKLAELGRISRKSREILNLGLIVHFLTLIQVELDSDLAPADLLRRLHPTPALGPLPRTAETMARLVGWRSRLGCPLGFGAPFGLWDPENGFEALVAIRGIWWQGRNLMLPAGCGIIEASRLVSEWRELRLKREAVKRFL